ncbi:MAG: DUF2203 domain-containing protein [Dehalococcoidia bacterium]
MNDGNEQAALFTLDEARATLESLRDLAPDGLRVPFSRADVAAVEAAGVEVKGPAQGLIDFPAEIAGIPAYWCWQSGEAGIEWWHPRDTGFAGRRRIEGDPPAR